MTNKYFTKKKYHKEASLIYYFMRPILITKHNQHININMLHLNVYLT